MWGLTLNFDILAKTKNFVLYINIIYVYRIEHKIVDHLPYPHKNHNYMYDNSTLKVRRKTIVTLSMTCK